MVVGHTVQGGGRPTVRCDGALVMLDIGMSRELGGRLGHTAALVCEPDAENPEGHTAFVLHGDTRERLPG